MQSTTTSIPLDYAPASGRTQTIASTVAWTAVGVGTLFLLGKAIALAGSGMPYGCWQLTGARAGASALVLGSLVTLRRGHLALFGALYALTLATSHFSPLLLASAVIAGIAAYALNRLLANRSLLVRLLATTLAFNVLLTLSGFVTAVSTGIHGRTGLANYSSGLGIRMAGTVIVAGTIALAAKRLAGRKCA